MWSQRFAPKTLNDVIPCDTGTMLRRVMAWDGSDNLVIVGPSGSGKTLIARLAMRQCLRPWRDAGMDASALIFEPSSISHMDMAASNSKNLALAKRVPGAEGQDDVLTLQGAIGEGMIRFAQRVVYWPPVEGAVKRRFVFVDNADNIPDDIQTALCRIHEERGQDVQWILCCEDASLLRSDLTSRAAHIYLTAPTAEQMRPRIERVVAENGLDPATVPWDIVRGNAASGLGVVLNTLQVYYAGSPAVSVVNLVPEPPSTTCAQILECCHDNELGAAISLLDDLWRGGFRASEILSALAKSCDDETSDALHVLAQAQRDVLRGLDSPLQLAAVLGRLAAVESL